MMEATVAVMAMATVMEAEVREGGTQAAAKVETVVATPTAAEMAITAMVMPMEERIPVAEAETVGATPAAVRAMAPRAEAVMAQAVIMEKVKVTRAVIQTGTPDVAAQEAMDKETLTEPAKGEATIMALIVAIALPKIPHHWEILRLDRTHKRLLGCRAF
ncbi:hypothetical protein AB4Y85_09910 [Microvirga sp. 2YAF29]|uniref:hypothetical protein n=1 Tax=Microvirga sp. 2YAF29 TaxID=3233031 RepID=UPI003F98D8CE